MCSGHSGVFTARPSATSTAPATAAVPDGRYVAAICTMSNVPASARDQQEPDQHQRRPEHREDQEPGGGPPPADRVVLVAPAVDHEPHRDQRDLEERRRTAPCRAPGSCRARRPRSAAAGRRARPARRSPGRGAPARTGSSATTSVRHQHQRRRDPVEPEVPVHVERGDPGHVDVAAVERRRRRRAHGPHRPAERDHARRATATADGGGSRRPSSRVSTANANGGRPAR